VLELREATVATFKAGAGALEHIRAGVGGLLECPTLVVGAGGREGAREERGAQQLVQGLADLRLPVPVLGLHRDALEVRGGDQVEEQQLFLVGGEAQGLDPALDLVVKEPDGRDHLGDHPPRLGEVPLAGLGEAGLRRDDVELVEPSAQVFVDLRGRSRSARCQVEGVVGALDPMKRTSPKEPVLRGLVK